MMKDNLDMRVAPQDAARLSNDVITKTDLVHFMHPDGGYKPGEEWADRYYHIETPETQRCGEMYTYTLDGYSYGIGRPLLAKWVGYLFAGAPDAENLIYKGHACVVLPNDVPRLQAQQYVGANGHLYLVLGPISQYYNSFTLSYRSGSTGEVVVHEKTKYKVHVRLDANRI